MTSLSCITCRQYAKFSYRWWNIFFRVVNVIGCGIMIFFILHQFDSDLFLNLKLNLNFKLEPFYSFTATIVVTITTYKPVYAHCTVTQKNMIIKLRKQN